MGQNQSFISGCFMFALVEVENDCFGLSGFSFNSIEVNPSTTGTANSSCNKSHTKALTQGDIHMSVHTHSHTHTLFIYYLHFRPLV